MRTGLGRLLARPTASRASVFSLTVWNPLQSTLSRNHQRIIASSSAVADAATENTFANTTLEQLPPSKKRSTSKADKNISFTIRKEPGRAPSELISPGIRRFANVWKGDLGFQSDVASDKPHPARRVDSDECRHDLGLWLQLLQYRARVRGPDGVALIWRGMRARNVELPTAGPEADIFWRTFLRHPDLTTDVIDYAVQIRRTKYLTYLPLYETVMAMMLADSSPSTLAWHGRLKEHYYIPSRALTNLCTCAASSNLSLNAFQKIYVDIKSRSDFIYDAMITALWRRNDTKKAMDWHAFLLRHGDMPSAAMSRSPMVHQLQRFDRKLSPTRFLGEGKKLPETDKAKLQPVPAATPREPTNKTTNPEVEFSRGGMYSLMGQAHGIAPKHFSDEFCARLFATKAFSTSFIISCLNMFGVQKIGPLALREMASRAGSPQAVTAKINDLQRAGIALGTDFFSRAIRRLARDNRGEILRSLLTSDQHPDVLEDMTLQRELLASYIEQDDWVSVHRTLTLLTLFHDDLAPQESWNILLRHYIRTRDLEKIQLVLEDMQMNGIQVTAHSIRRLYKCCLTRRQPAKRPDVTDVYSKRDYLIVVTNIFFRIMDLGQLLPSRYWHEIIRRYGMTGRFEDLSRLCIRLAHYYSPSTNPEASPHRRLLHVASPTYNPIVGADDVDPRLAMQLHSSHPAHPLRQIFSPAALRAIVGWGFEYGSKQLRDHPERMRTYMLIDGKRVDDLQWPSHITPPSPSTTYLSGIGLIDALIEIGVNVETAVVRRAVMLRLWQLLSPGRSVVKSNVQAKAVNPYSLEQILDCLLDQWRGPPLFPGLLLNTDDVLKRAKKKRKKQKKQRRTEQGNGVLTSQQLSQDTLSTDLRKPNVSQTDTQSHLPLVSSASTPAQVPLHLPQQSSRNQTSSSSRQRLVHPRYPTILDGLVPKRTESSDSILLSEQEIIRRRTQLAYAVFGTAPAVGGKRSMYGRKRIDLNLWMRSVKAWARRPLASKARMFDGVRWSWKGAVTRASQLRRRSHFHVEKPTAK
jgi:pentatricopeptide repeat protein